MTTDPSGSPLGTRGTRCPVRCRSEWRRPALSPARGNPGRCQNGPAWRGRQTTSSYWLNLASVGFLPAISQLCKLDFTFVLSLKKPKKSWVVSRDVQLQFPQRTLLKIHRFDEQSADWEFSSSFHCCYDLNTPSSGGASTIGTLWLAAGVWAAVRTRTLCSTAPTRKAGCPFQSAPWRRACTAAALRPAGSGSVNQEDYQNIKDASIVVAIITATIYSGHFTCCWALNDLIQGCLLKEQVSLFQMWNELKGHGERQRRSLATSAAVNGGRCRKRCKATWSRVSASCLRWVRGKHQRQTPIHLEASQRKPFSWSASFSVNLSSHRPRPPFECTRLRRGPVLNQENTLFLCVAEVVALQQKEDASLPKVWKCEMMSEQLKWKPTAALSFTEHSLNLSTQLHLKNSMVGSDNCTFEKLLISSLNCIIWTHFISFPLKLQILQIQSPNISDCKIKLSFFTWKDQQSQSIIWHSSPAYTFCPPAPITAESRCWRF